MNFKTYINDLNISEGDSIRSDCPSCRGRKTFTVTKMEGKVLYNCYKLGCNTRGVEATGYTKREIGERLSRLQDDTPSVDEFIMPDHITHDISNYKLQNFIKRWNISDVYVMYDVRDDRIVFPIRDSRGKLIDAIGRSLSYSSIKWMRYGGEADYYLSGSKSFACAIVVEDVISALIASKLFQVTGVAILGTSLSLKHKQLLSKYEKVLVALDPDATSKTLSYTLDLRNYVKSVSAVGLCDDIKYKNKKDLIKIEDMINGSKINKLHG